MAADTGSEDAGRHKKGIRSLKRDLPFIGRSQKGERNHGKEEKGR